MSTEPARVWYVTQSNGGLGDHPRWHDCGYLHDSPGLPPYAYATPEEALAAARELEAAWNAEEPRASFRCRVVRRTEEVVSA